MKMCKSFLLIFILFSSLVIKADDPKRFGHEIYQVKPNPKAQFETLKNGFRYILLPNKTPEKRVFVYLFVNSGSLNETDKQQGLAHFLEHMAFNGTKNYPGENMIAFFKKIGMDFGGDTNAYTDFGETVYSLNLPDEKLMKEGISIMSDYAMNMLLTTDEIEKERGVILSEKRERDDIEYRIQLQGFQFAMPGSIVANRFPIGLEDSIKKFKREDFVDYYQTWYRPENMVLIVVGDIDSKKWNNSIKKSFDSFIAKAPKREAAIIKDVGHQGVKINYYFEKESTDTKIEISTLVVRDSINKTFTEKTKVELAESAASYILNGRMAELLAQKDIPLNTGLISTGVWLKRIHSGTIEATCKPENWKSSLSLLENELRKAILFGFTDQEILLFKKEQLSQLETAVNNMSTRDSQSYIYQIIGSLSEDTPFLDAKQYRDLALPLIEKLTKEEVLKEFQKYWQVEHRLVNVNGNADIKDAENEIRKVYDDAKAKEVALQKDAALITFPYEEKPLNTSTILSKEEFLEHDFSRVTFSNNVVLNLKKTDFKKNEIIFNINFGLGGLSVPKGKEGLSHLAGIIMNEGGLEKLSKTDLVKAFAGKNVMAYFSVNANSFMFNAQTTPVDFELNLQLCRAMLLNPGFREEANEKMKKSIDQIYLTLASNISDHFQNIFFDKATNGNRFLYFPEKEIVNSFHSNDVKTWLSSEFKNSAIEINIVGDIDIKNTIDSVSVYFGSLPERKKLETKSKIDLALKKPFAYAGEFESKIKKAIMYIMFPTVDFHQIAEVRQLNLLGKILDEKTMKLVREKLSISYAPSAGHSYDQDFKNFCHLQFMAEVEPQNLKPLESAFESIIKDVYENGITSQDLESVRKPTLNQIKDYIKTNEYWLDRVLTDSVVEPENLKYANTFLKHYEAITVQQINAMIKKYLMDNNRSVIVLSTIEEKIKKDLTK